MENSPDLASPLGFVNIRLLKARLSTALERDRSPQWCFRLWSKFIKARDSNRCVCCESTSSLQAHHIVRKSLYPWGVFELGNGITLCLECHQQVHAQFNGRPSLNQPIGAEGGDDQDEWAFLYGLLLSDATERCLDQDEFYFIGDHMVQFFLRCQGYEELYRSLMEGECSRLRYAHEVWRVMPESWYTDYVSKIIQLNLR